MKPSWSRRVDDIFFDRPHLPHIGAELGVAHAVVFSAQPSKLSMVPAVRLLYVKDASPEHMESAART